MHLPRGIVQRQTRLEFRLLCGGRSSRGASGKRVPAASERTKVHIAATAEQHKVIVSALVVIVDRAIGMRAPFLLLMPWHDSDVNITQTWLRQHRASVSSSLNGGGEAVKAFAEAAGRSGGTQLNTEQQAQSDLDNDMSYNSF